MYGQVLHTLRLQIFFNIVSSHTDYGTTTLLFSVPVTALQIWGSDNKWRYIKYKPGALVINLGETLEGNTGISKISAKAS